MSELRLDGQRYQILRDAVLVGRKGLTTRLRTSDPETDPGRIRKVRWAISGPIGQSRESPEGFLGVDYVINLDHRHDNLVTSTATRDTLTLSSADPLSTGSAALGSLELGARALGGGAHIAVPQNLKHFDEDKNRLFCHRGAMSTQVDIASATPSVEHTVAQDSIVEDAATWFGTGYLALGNTTAIQKRTSVSSSSSSYSDVQISGSDVHAKGLEVGNDRLWMIDADEGADNENKLRFTLDNFVTRSNPFIAGDPKVTATGLGTLGPLTAMGNHLGAFSFTNAGQPVRLLESLKGHRSEFNGAVIQSLWGWMYVTTDLGLFAWDGSFTTNPVGPESLEGFEGPIDGKPIALWPYKDSLFCTYLSETGDSWTIRGRFGPETARSGLPNWFVFRRFSSTECFGLFSTSLRTNPTLLIGEGASTLSYYTLGRRGRDIADANYSFSIDGGQWFGSTLMRSLGMRNFLREAKFITENCTAANTWQLAVQVDEGVRTGAEDYIDVGHPVVENGQALVRPNTGGSPDQRFTFHTLKPRLTQVAASTTAPPQIRGFLDLTYDERPQMIEETTVALLIENEQQRSRLIELVRATDSDHVPPVEVKRPSDDEKQHGFVMGVDELRDIKSDDIEGVTITIQVWANDV